MKKNNLLKIIVCVIVLATVVLLFCVAWSIMEGKKKSTEVTYSKNDETAEGKEGIVEKELSMLGLVLLGKETFCYVAEDEMRNYTVNDVVSFFGEATPYRKIWQFAYADMDGDGEKEVIIHVISAGDDGGKVILHRIDEEIYAYITDNRHLWDLKEDGTYGYALMSNSNDGYAMITDFSKKGYSEDVFMYETGSNGEMDTYIVNHELSNAEAFRKAVIQQKGKKSVKWYEFNEENIKEMFCTR
ncbi:MAG: hypothetical protein IKO41_10450 [Lachnospiraceae bacterium]|nr:hypothetical protein [Lachnospiraceae bacterium]